MGCGFGELGSSGDAEAGAVLAFDGGHEDEKRDGFDEEIVHVGAWAVALDDDFAGEGSDSEVDVLFGAGAGGEAGCLGHDAHVVVEDFAAAGLEIVFKNNFMLNSLKNNRPFDTFLDHLPQIVCF
jgi:hypothetical protein